MPRPRPVPRCVHVQTGTRPHDSHGRCKSCAVAWRQTQPGGLRTQLAATRGALLDLRHDLPGEQITGAACPLVRCPQCGRRIGGGNCPKCAPARVGALADDRAAAAWARGCPARDPPALLRSEYTWAMAWVLAHGWAELPQCCAPMVYCRQTLD